MRTNQRNSSVKNNSFIGGLASTSMIQSSSNKNLFRTEPFSLDQEMINPLRLIQQQLNTTSNIRGSIGASQNGSLKIYPNNDIYYGGIKNDKPHGNGLYQFMNMRQESQYLYYSGRFQNGKFSGQGRLCRILPNNRGQNLYVGIWKNGKRQGKGSEFYNQQSSVYYQGNWVNDFREGRGIFYMPDNIKYDGNWVGGRMHGEGVMQITRGPFMTVISGQWINDDIREGKITYYAKQNKLEIGQYRGSIRNLMRDGEGVYRQGDTILQGVFKEDNLLGTSKIKNANKKDVDYIITGDLNKQLRNLNADIKYKNNDRYMGLVNINQNHRVMRTEGTYYYADGTVKKGKFEEKEDGQIITKNQ